MNTHYSDLSLSGATSRRLFGEKIAQYAQLEPCHFLQLDAEFGPYFDDKVQFDWEGDFLSACRTVEFMEVSSVRVLIAQGTNPKIASRQLIKLAEMLRTKPELLDYANPDLSDT
jgi:hypothetical protein